MDDGLPPLRAVLHAHRLSAEKKFGQNFLLDFNITEKIARLAGPLEGKTIVEIGPGPGGLTRALLYGGAGKVIAVESDHRCAPIIEQICTHYPDQVELHLQDAMTVDFTSLTDQPYEIVANLPYNIGTALLVNWLQLPWPPCYGKMTLMFQREVAERIVAAPNSKAYGRLSVLAQWRCRSEIIYHIPPQAFTPPPKVNSAMVQFIPYPKMQPACDIAMLSKVTAAAFGGRRKMLRQSLKSLTQTPEILLDTLGISPKLRAENLSPIDFCNIARQLEFSAQEQNGPFV